MVRTAQLTRERVIDAAYGLFYRRGFTRVSMDEIAERASITKRTLYAHFASKDELLACVLEAQSELALARLTLRQDNYAGRASEAVERLFTDLAEWSKSPGWAGAGFTRLAMELGDLPGHPARVMARRHKASIEAWWASRFTEAGVAEPAKRAREVVLLLEGAMVKMLIHGDRTYAEAAGAAAKRLLETRDMAVERKDRDRLTEGIVQVDSAASAARTVGLGVGKDRDPQIEQKSPSHVAGPLGAKRVEP
jgi:AcrR family transcriptional regulator